jgi:methionine aminopeptidase
MKEGHTFTIEPVIVEGKTSFSILKDKWTAVSKASRRSCLRPMPKLEFSSGFWPWCAGGAHCADHSKRMRDSDESLTLIKVCITHNEEDSKRRSQGLPKKSQRIN